ncbi:TetR family transcriptional regulator [Mycobacterium kansasii]|uniref:TetR family transcriptional regulator n=2 Tax=Mycobacterium TaxID=1763 RepID=A0A1A3CVJ7_MYCAS|nr:MULTISPECIES: TetR family transcriptional regulator [Mycobacterium]MBI2702626.1 TetR/AcrR family transcriptional regulator [Mycobacterium sp.]AYE98117.1 TetR/AcrR family transcriptional regulator [Mycobacterium paragordonae]MDP7725748.1 TetR family transcriptional regulator [Mycobacterium sp. TY814]MDP7739161.1 TetR family transcriptional regulator [Mycobacterium paragordonae]OBI90840.1 TetR family transcriptional regulator [Mycobacterium asiaticum]
MTAAQPAADAPHASAILDATLHAATRGGYSAVQMRAVADVAGIGVGTLYRYFPSKPHLLVAVLRREFDRLAAECAWHHHDITPARRVAALTSRLHAEWQLDPKLTEATTRALVVADATAAPTVTQAADILHQLFARALGGNTVTERHHDLAGLITDVWLANLTAFSGHRLSAGQARERIDRGTGLLLRHAFGPVDR